MLGKRNHKLNPGYTDKEIYDRLNRTSYGARFRMNRRKARRNRLILMLLIFVVAAATTVGAVYNKKSNDALEKQKELKQAETMDAIREAKEDINIVSANIEKKQISAGVIVASAAESKEKNTAKEGTAEKQKTDSKNTDKAKKAGMDYFSDAVFVGDSRTEGLIISTGLSKAAFYGGKGLMIDTAFTSEIVRDKSSGKKITVISALSKKQFGKVYIMFGVNELGWPYDDVFISKYKKLVNKIKKLQPNAVIYVQSILPVSKEKETKDKIYNNKKIRRYNKLIKQMAAEEKVVYLDVASAVKDKNGVLPKAASTDGVHLNKKYCEIWLDYLKTHTKEKK